jgi:hypothetical protein
MAIPTSIFSELLGHGKVVTTTRKYETISAMNGFNINAIIGYYD